MKNSKTCPKCSSRRLLIVHNVRQLDSNTPLPLPLCAAIDLAQVTAGELEAGVCMRCGYVELYARKLDEVLTNLGALSSVATLVDGDFAEGVASLGLAAVDDPASLGWQFLAQGVVDTIPLTIGQRSRPRIVDHGIRHVLWVEILAKARADLGNMVLRRNDAIGREVRVAYREVGRSGDLVFDAYYSVVSAAYSNLDEEATLPDAERPIFQLPWLDSTVVEHVIASQAEEVFLIGESVGLLLRDHDLDRLAHAVALALHLAKWPGPSKFAYR